MLTAGLVGVTIPATAADSGCPAASAAYSGGTGVEGDPYLISVPGDLQKLHVTPADWGTSGSTTWTPHYRLTADIDMTGCTWRDQGLGKTAWGTTDRATFQAVFDGDGHEVFGLTITAGGNNPYPGLFFSTGPTTRIHDLGFRGTVVGTAGRNGTAGGLIGLMRDSTVERVWSSATVTTTANGSFEMNTGGLIGQMIGGLVADSFATGSVSATRSTSYTGSALTTSTAGGLIGALDSGTVTRSYATGGITLSDSSDSPGRLVGNRGASSTVSSSVCLDGPCVGSGSASGVTALSSGEMSDFTTYSSAGWDIGYGASTATGTTWGICSSAPYLAGFYASDQCTATAPAIGGASASGTASAGQVLTGSTSAVTGTPTPSLAYAWQVADTSGGTYAAAPGSGSTASAYTVASADLGKYVRLQVTATNPAGSAVAYSSVLGPVSGTAPSIGGVTVSGDAAVGSTLTALGTSVAGIPTPALAYAWEVGATAAGTWASGAGTGATTDSYIPDASEAGQWVRATATATNGEGPAATADSTAVQIGPAVSVSLSGSVAGSTATATAIPASSTLQWQRETSAGSGSYADISGETGTTYETTASDVGRQLRVVGTYSGASTASGATSAVTALDVSTPPVISGTAVVGGTLSATAAAANAGTVTYAWQRETSAGSGSYSATGDAGRSYALTAGDVGLRLRIVATTTNGSQTATGTSNVSAVVVPSGAISGDAVVGSLLTATATSGSSVQWEREDAPSSGTYSALGGETGANYTVSAADVGLRLRVELSNNGATVQTGATSAVAALSVTAPSLSGTGTVLQVLTRGTSTANAGTITYSWQTSPDGFSWSDTGETGTTLTLSAPDVNTYVRARATAANGGVSTTSDSAALGPIAAAQLADPTNLTVSGGSGTGTLSVTFDAPVNAPLSQTYDLSVYSSASLTDLAATVTGYTSGATVTGLASGRRYWATVTAVASTGYLAATSAAESGSATSPSPSSGSSPGGSSSGSAPGAAGDSGSVREIPVQREPGAAITDAPRPVDRVTRPALPPVTTSVGSVRVPLEGSFGADVDSQRPRLLRGGIDVPTVAELGKGSEAIIIEAEYRASRTTDARAEVPVDELVQLTGPKVPGGTQVAAWVQDRAGSWFALGSFRAGSDGVAVAALRLTETGEYILAMTTESSTRRSPRASTKEPEWGSSVMRVFVTVVPKAMPSAAPASTPVSVQASFTFGRDATRMSGAAAVRLQRAAQRCASVDNVIVRQGRALTSPRDAALARKRAAAMRTAAAKAAGLPKSRVKVTWRKQVAPTKTSVVFRCAR